MLDTDSQRLYSSVRLAPRPHKLRCPRTDSSPRPGHLLITVQRCACACMVRDTPPLSCGQSSVSFCTHPHPSQPSCPQLPRKLHVLTSPAVLAFISCMLYIARRSKTLGLARVVHVREEGDCRVPALDGRVGHELTEEARVVGAVWRTSAMRVCHLSANGWIMQS